MLRWLALAALVAAGCVSAADAQQHDPGKDFDLHADNTFPTGMWSDSTTMWVADQTADKIFAYHMSNMSRYPDNDFPLHADNTDPFGIWSDGTTMWVVDNVDIKIYAYKMLDKSRDDTKDFDTLSISQPAGIWSDCTTMWVSERFVHNPKIFAYNLATKASDAAKDFGTLPAAGHTFPTGIWSDGTTMWAAEYYLSSNDDKVFAYRMHSASTPCPAPTTPAVSPPRVFVYIPPPDTTPPTVKSVERTGNATTTDHTLTWNVRFSESVRVGLAALHTNYTSVANATIPDLGMASDTLLADVPGAVTGGSVSVDIHHPITSGLLIELVAPDCTRFVVHNQTTTFLYKLRQPYDLGDLSGVGAAGQWTLHVYDRAKYWNGTLNGWTLYLESEGVVEGSGRTHTITQYVAGPGNYTLSLDGFDIRDRAGNRLVDTDTAVNEPYHVVGTVARTCQTE